MGLRHSSQHHKELAMTKRYGKQKLKEPLSCPICDYTFAPKIFSYADFDVHMEAHVLADEEVTSDPVHIQENITFPEVETQLLPVRNRLGELKVHWSILHKEIYVTRDSLLKDSLYQLMSLSTQEMRSELHIIFQGEKINDAGGVTKEWLGLLVKELFSENLGLFRLGTGKEPRYLPVSHCNNRPLYYLTGLALAKGILENICVDCSLSKTVLKHLLSCPVGIRGFILKYDL